MFFFFHSYFNNRFIPKEIYKPFPPEIKLMLFKVTISVRFIRCFSFELLTMYLQLISAATEKFSTED